MFLKIPFQWFARPSHLSMLAVGASFLAWEFPSFGVLRKGFTYAQPLDLTSGLTLGLWYLLIFASFLMGQTCGRSVSSSTPHLHIPSIDEDTVYRCFSLLTLLGTVTMLVKIFQVLPPPMVMLALASGQANRLGEALHENYSFGVVSLRYLVVYSAALSFARIIRFRKLSPSIVLNLIMLVFNITARLILIATLLNLVFLLNYRHKFVKINLVKVLLFGFVTFGALSTVNFARNANYYESTGSSFFQAGVSEILAYLGSPFQVSVGAAKALNDVVANIAPLEGDPYRTYVDVEDALNTNSAFLALHLEYGYAAWFAIALTCFSMGFLFSLMLDFGNTALLLPCAGILYGSTELWRVDLYQQGIFIVWLTCGIAVPLLLALIRKGHSTAAAAYPLKRPIRHTRGS